MGIRHVQMLMVCLAMAFSSAMRITLSLAIVEMTDTTKENSFDWDLKTQSVVLSAFFWGYVMLQIPGGILAARFGGRILLLMNLGVDTVISFVMPAAAIHGGWPVVCVGRFIQGLFQGFLYPCAHNLLGKWVPPEERSRFGTLVFGGAMLGYTEALVFSGFIAHAWGWPAIFYVNGVFGAIWVLVYVFVGADSPQTSKMIGDEERKFIQEALGQVGGHKRLKTPWKSIFTCVPFYALMIAHCGQNWGFFTLMALIPTFMANVLDVNIKKNGVLSALPYLTMFVLSFPTGLIADRIYKKQLLSLTNTRKLFNSIGEFGPAIALIGLSYSPHGNLPLAVILLILVVGLNVGHMAGFMLVHIDMAPNFAGIMMGITNCFANMLSLMAPLAAGAIILDQKDPNEWRKVFFLASAVYIVGNTVFLIFGSSERQKWNDPQPPEPPDAEETTTQGKTLEQHGNPRELENDQVALREKNS